MPSWDDLKPKQAPADTPVDELASLAFAALGSGVGKQLLERLHKIHVDKRANPQMEERALRVFESDRQFVLRLEDLTSRGRELHANRRREAE